VDSIRQVDVDLNFLLVECSSVDWIFVGNFFGGGQNTLAAHPML